MISRPNLKGVPFLLICAVAAWGLGAGCNCVPDLRPDGGIEDGGDGGDQDAGPDGGPDVVDGGPDGGPMNLPDGGQCITTTGTCTQGGTPCCSGSSCIDGACVAAIFCAPTEAACTANTQCCSGSCVGNLCSADRCNNIGEGCSNGVDCCSGNCSGNFCAQAVASSCLATGSSCSEGADTCCSQNCRNGVCERAYTCNTTGDVCYSGDDCCSLLCSATGGNAGVCQTGSGGFCQQAGSPCDSGGNCCSKVCADPGSGQKVCQAVSGCRPAGDSCTSDLSCCGGEPFGTVDCGNANSLCDNGQACRAPGTICGKPTEADGGCARKADGTCFEVNNETNCCGSIKIGSRDLTCKVDEVGVPRCFGQGDGGEANCPTGLTGEAGCCIDQGDICNFADQCCNDAACVPDDLGVRRCTVSSCIPLGTDCEPVTDGGNSGCCSGSCLPTSEITYACQLGAGSTDGGGCQSNGETCTSSGQCCSNICEGGQCVADTCQGVDEGCSVSGDCCDGLTCNVPAGQTTGTCKAGATCPSAGQNCSPTNLCCGEGTSLQCLNPSGFACDGTTSCACEFIITKQAEPVEP